MKSFYFALIASILLIAEFVHTSSAAPTSAPVISCQHKWCSAIYKYQKHKGACHIFGCKSKRYKDTKYRWCAEIYNAVPRDTFRSTIWDKTRLKAIGGLSNKRCANRKDIGDGSCKWDSSAHFHGLFKC